MLFTIQDLTPILRGGKLGDDTHYRVYAEYFNRDSGVDASGDDMADDWEDHVEVLSYGNGLVKYVEIFCNSGVLS